MSFSWGDFCTLARELIEASDTSDVSEAAVRCSLGRSYYAVFGAARDVLRDRGVDISRQSAHASLRRRLAKSEDPQERRIARALSRLFRLRIEADYYAEPGVPLTRELAEEANHVADEALAVLASEDGDPAEPDKQ